MTDEPSATIQGPTNAGRYWIRFTNGYRLVDRSERMMMFDTRADADAAADAINERVTAS